VAYTYAHSQVTDVHPHSPSPNSDPDRGCTYSNADAHSNGADSHDNAVADARTSNHHTYTCTRYDHAHSCTRYEHTNTHTRYKHANNRTSNRNVYADTGLGLWIEHEH